MTEDSAAIGIDLGGTKFHVGLVDRAGRVLASRKDWTRPEAGLDRLLDAIAQRVRECTEEASVAPIGVAVGVSGQVDARDRVVRSAPNLHGWRDVPLARRLEERLGLLVLVGNDLGYIARGEARYGAGRGVEDLVVLFVGTGVGGGVITGRRVLVGVHGYAGELGHVPVVAEGRPCHCGGRGCLEAYVSGWALARRARERIAGDPARAEALRAAAGTDDGEITAATIGRAHAAGHALARELVDEAGRYLAAGVTGIANVFDPARIVLGGGVIDGLPVLVDVAARAVRERALPAVRDEVEVVRSELGSTAGVLGAATRVWEVLGPGMRRA